MQNCKETRDLKSKLDQILNSENSEDIVVKYYNPENKEKFQIGLKSNYLPSLPLNIRTALKDFHLTTDARLEAAGINFIKNTTEIVKLQPSEPKIKNANGTVEPVLVIEKVKSNVTFSSINLKQIENENQNQRKKNPLLRKRSNTLADVPVKKAKLSNINSSEIQSKTSQVQKNYTNSKYKNILEEFVPQIANFDGKNHPFHVDNLKYSTSETTILRKIRNYHFNKKEIKRTRKRKEGKFGKNYRKRIFNLQNGDVKLPSSSSSSVSEESSIKSSLTIEQKQEVLKQRLTNNNNNSINKSTDSYKLLSEILQNGETKCEVKKNVEISLKSPTKNPSMSAYFLKMLDDGDKIAEFDILSERVLDDGSKQYLVLWDNSCPKFILDSL
jgi:hypothetical protein